MNYARPWNTQDSEWLWKEVKEILVNRAETEDSRPILYKVQANGILVIALFDMDAGMSIMSSKFFSSIVNKPKVFKCNRKVRIAGGDTLVSIGECYIELKIGKKVLQDRVIIIKNLNRDYIIGVAIQCANKMLTSFSMLGRPFISLNGEMIVQSVSSITTQPILKCKSRTCLKLYAVTIIVVQAPPNLDLHKLYECREKLQLKVL